MNSLNQQENRNLNNLTDKEILVCLVPYQQFMA